MLLQLKWICGCSNHPGPKDNFGKDYRDDFRGRRRRRYVSPLSDYSDEPHRRRGARSRSVDSLHNLIQSRHPVVYDRYDDYSLPPVVSPDLTQDLDQLRRRVSDSNRTASPTSRFHIACASALRFGHARKIVVGPKQQVEAAFPFLSMKWVHMQRESMDFDEFQVRPPSIDSPTRAALTFCRSPLSTNLERIRNPPKQSSPFSVRFRAKDYGITALTGSHRIPDAPSVAEKIPRPDSLPFHTFVCPIHLMLAPLKEARDPF